MNRVNIHTHRPADGQTTLLCAGIHPWLADDASPADAAALRGVLGASLDKAQAIGETGLDFACTASRTAQERLFRAHLELAAGMRLPVVIHCVRAFEPTMKILGEYPLRRVLFHGFIGSVQQAQRAVEAGYRLSFGVRSLRSPRTVEAMRTVPAEKIFVETDDDPVTIDEVYRMAAEALSTDIGTLELRLIENFKNFTDNG